jgi:hypothetical protein
VERLLTLGGSPLLTPEESKQFKQEARWLRRAAHPFKDFYNIVAIGATGTSTAAEMARRQDDPEVRDLLKDL